MINFNAEITDGRFLEAVTPRQIVELVEELGFVDVTERFALAGLLPNRGWTGVYRMNGETPEYVYIPNADNSVDYTNWVWSAVLGISRACQIFPLQVLDTLGVDWPSHIDKSYTDYLNGLVEKWQQRPKAQAESNPAVELLQNFANAKQALYDHVGFVEDWVVYAIEDRTPMFWMVDGTEMDWVRYAESEEKLASGGDYYEDEIYTQRFYPKWVYRGEKLTMILVDTHTDGNRFFQFFDNAKEIKVQHER